MEWLTPLDLSGPQDPTEDCPSKMGVDEMDALASLMEEGSDVVILSSVESGVRVIDPSSGSEVSNGSVIHFNPLLFRNGGCLSGPDISAEVKMVLELGLSRNDMTMRDKSSGEILWQRSVPSFIVEAHGLNGVETIEVDRRELMENGGGQAKHPILFSEDGGRSMVLIPSDTLGPIDHEKAYHVDSRTKGPRRLLSLPGYGHSAGRISKSRRSSKLVELAMATAFGAMLFIAPVLVYLLSRNRTAASNSLYHRHSPLKDGGKNAGSNNGNLPSMGSEDLSVQKQINNFEDNGDRADVGKKKKKKKKKAKLSKLSDQEDVYSNVLVGKTTYGFVPQVSTPQFACGKNSEKTSRRKWH